MPGARSCFHAIAAVSGNGVIGRKGGIPWNIPDELRWFRRKTMGSHVLMGRSTYLGLPRSLDGRTHLVLSRRAAQQERPTSPGFEGFRPWSPEGREPPGRKQDYLLSSLSNLEDWLESWSEGPPRIFVCGGAEIYRQLLPRCSELFCSRVFLDVEGDRFLPSLDGFELAEVLLEHEEFRVERYLRKAG